MSDDGRQIGRRVGQRLRELRQRAGLTQAQLAEQVRPSVEPETISRFERGVHVPSFATVEALAVALGTDLDGFLAGMLSRRVEAQETLALQGVLDLLNPLDEAQVQVVRRLLVAHLEGLALGGQGGERE